MTLSLYADEAILNHIVGKTSFTMPTAYVALSTTDPGKDGSGITEPSGGAYARVATAGSDWNAAASDGGNPAKGTISNANAIAFPKATADWLSGANLAYFVLFDAASGGNMLGSGSINVPKAVLNGDTMNFPAGDLTITQD